MEVTYIFLSIALSYPIRDMNALIGAKSKLKYLLQLKLQVEEWLGFTTQPELDFWLCFASNGKILLTTIGHEAVVIRPTAIIAYSHIYM